MQYQPNKIEAKWQKYWDKQGTFKAPDDFKKKKFYSLIEFPYPSGEGLHTGHLRPITAMDVVSRYKRMAGYNVLYPIGMDAFGLPAENYAVKTNTPPQITTVKNIKTFNRQLKSIGYSFDWSRFLATTDKDYYKWTQWIFIQMFNKGLAYKAKENINWCPSCKIGLANEEVVGGNCERCGTQVVKQEKEQWLLKITKYADRLIEGLDKVDFLEQIKKQQKDWIGKSEGAEVAFKIKSSEETLKVFTTRPDTLFGATFMVLAPEHEIIHKLEGSISNLKDIKKYISASVKKTDIDRGKTKTGVELKGISAINPVNNKEIPIFVADYVLMSYGTGAIMAVPAHDQRDYEFAKKYKLDIVPVIEGGDTNKAAYTDTSSGKVINSDKYNGLSVKEFQKKIVKWLETNGTGKAEVNYKLHDWIFSRQRYWGEPIPMIYCESCAVKKEQVLILHGWEDSSEAGFIPALKHNLESKGYEVFAFNAPNADEPEFKEWYSFITKKIKENNLKDFHIVGHSMGGHLAMKLAEDYKLKSLNLIAPVGFKASAGYFNQFKKELGPEEIAVFKKYQNNPLSISKVKANAKRINFIFGAKDKWITKEIRDYYINNFKSVADIEIIEGAGHLSGDEGIKSVSQIEGLFNDLSQMTGWQPVPEKDLPVELPDIKDFKPTKDGQSPLAKAKDWLNTSCPSCGGQAQRETDVMPNWAGSNWYFIRYTDPQNNKELVDKAKARYWLPVDWYNGGMEHTTLHLLYSRFIYKFLYDIGVVPSECGDEPYKKRTAQGMILGKGGVKMSKSKGNVVNPDDYLEKYGADTIRVYEMFMGPFDQAIAWDDKGVVGIYKFLTRVANLESKVKDTKANKDNNKLLHQTIKKVATDIDSMRFNTAISQMMIMVNNLEKEKEIAKDLWQDFVKLLSPFAPHLAEELWSKLGYKESIAHQAWPQYSDKLVQVDTVKIGIQINGKLRDDIELDFDTSPSAKLEKEILARDKVKKYIAGKEVKKFIHIKNKIISIVMK